MREFYIKQIDIQNMRQKITMECETLLQDIADCRTQIRQLVGNESFQGDFADSMKSYLTEIHQPVLDAAGRIAREFQTRIRRYETGYEPIEGGWGFALPEETMAFFSRELTGYEHRFTDCHDRILNAMMQVSDVIPLTGPETSLVYQATRGLVGDIKKLIQEVSDYEDFSRETIELLHKLVDLFSECVNRVIRLEERGSDYVSGYNTRIREMQELADTFAAEDLKDTEFTPGMLKNLKKYGYSPSEIKAFYDNCCSEEDIQFFLLLAEGRYMEAFQQDPTELNQEMDMLMADFALRVFQTGGMQEFQELNNAILAGWQEYAVNEYHWSIFDRWEYRKLYIRKMFAGTELLMDLNSCLLLSGNGDEKAKERNWNLLTLKTIWDAQYQIMEKYGETADPEYPYYVQFDRMNPTLGQVDFQFLFMEEALFGKKKSRLIPVKTELLETTEDLFTAEYLVERSELVREADNLWESVLTDGLNGAFRSVVSIVLPEFAAAFGIIDALLRDPDALDNSVRKAHGSEKSTEEKAASALGQEALDAIQSYRRRRAELIRAIREKDRKYQNALWGSGAIARFGDEASVISGIYNPDYLETLGNWNREGIQALLPEVDMKAIEKVMEQQFPEVKTNGLVSRMIHGFGRESILEYSMDQIAEAKTTLEQIIRMADNRYERWNVEDAF